MWYEILKYFIIINWYSKSSAIDYSLYNNHYDLFKVPAINNNNNNNNKTNNNDDDDNINNNNNNNNNVDDDDDDDGDILAFQAYLFRIAFISHIQFN